MPKFLLSIVAFLLLPCLVVDPSLASALFHQTTDEPKMPNLQRDVLRLNDEALCQPVLANNRIEARIHEGRPNSITIASELERLGLHLLPREKRSWFIVATPPPEKHIPLKSHFTKGNGWALPENRLERVKLRVAKYRREIDETENEVQNAVRRQDSVALKRIQEAWLSRALEQFRWNLFPGKSAFESNPDLLKEFWHLYGRDEAIMRIQIIHESFSPQPSALPPAQTLGTPISLPAGSGNTVSSSISQRIGNILARLEHEIEAIQSTLRNPNIGGRSPERIRSMVDSIWIPHELHEMVQSQRDNPDVLRRYVKILVGFTLFFKPVLVDKTIIAKRAEFWLGEFLRYFNMPDLINSVFRGYLRKIESAADMEDVVWRIHQGLSIVLPGFSSLDEFRHLLLRIGDWESGIAIIPGTSTEPPVIIVYGGDEVKDGKATIRHRFIDMTIETHHTHGYGTPLIPSERDTLVAESVVDSEHGVRPNFIYAVDPFDHHVEIAWYDRLVGEWRFFRENDSNRQDGLHILRNLLNPGKQKREISNPGGS